MRLPGVIPAKTVINAPASHHDLFPSILDYLGQPARPSEGRSLRPLIENPAADSNRIAISEWPAANLPGFRVTDRRWQLLFGRNATNKSLDALYDLQSDPHEMNNLVGRNPQRDQARAEATRMKGPLVDWLTRVNSPLLESVRQRPL